MTNTLAYFALPSLAKKKVLEHTTMGINVKKAFQCHRW